MGPGGHVHACIDLGGVAFDWACVFGLPSWYGVSVAIRYIYTTPLHARTCCCIPVVLKLYSTSTNYIITQHALLCHDIYFTKTLRYLAPPIVYFIS